MIHRCNFSIVTKAILSETCHIQCVECNKTEFIPVSTCKNDIKFFLEYSLAFETHRQQHTKLWLNLFFIQALFHSFFLWMNVIFLLQNAKEHFIFFLRQFFPSAWFWDSARKKWKCRRRRWHVFWMNEDG